MRITIYTSWKDELECCCYVKNPLCNKYKECEEIDVKFNTYDDLNECTKQRKYKKVGGVIKQL